MLIRVLPLAALLVPLPVLAQTVNNSVAPAVEEEESICLAFATRFVGTNAEVRDIERTPVPERFREEFESTDWCKHLEPESLIDWHLFFGSEASATAALTYLERAYMRDTPAPGRFQDELEKAWRAARGDQGGPLPGFQRLADETSSTYRFLAGQYLRVAEDHGSLILLDKAQLYFDAAIAGDELLTSLVGLEPPRRTRDLTEADDLVMRAAVLRADLVRTPEAIARAEAAIDERERPNFRSLGEDAFTGGDDFCDLGRNAREDLRSECEDDEDSLHDRVVSYLTARALLDLILDDDDPTRGNRTPDLALRLLERERYFDRGRSYGLPAASELLLHLHLALADYHRRHLVSGGDALYDALDELKQAERLAPPFDAPGRFDRIAREWLELYRSKRATEIAEGDTPGSRDERYAAYLTQTLASLQVIARGAE